MMLNLSLVMRFSHTRPHFYTPKQLKLENNFVLTIIGL